MRVFYLQRANIALGTAGPVAKLKGKGGNSVQSSLEGKVQGSAIEPATAAQSITHQCRQIGASESYVAPSAPEENFLTTELEK